MKKMIAKIAKGAYVVLAIGGAALGAILCIGISNATADSTRGAYGSIAM